MASEIQVSATLSVTKAPASQLSRSIASLAVDLTGSKYMSGIQSIATSAVALALGPVTAPAWMFVRNTDPTNFVQLLTGTAGTVFAKLKPLEIALLRLDPTVTAPAAQANTAACVVEYLLIEN